MKKNIIKIIAAMLALLMLVFAFAACDGDKKKPDGTDTGDGTGTDTGNAEASGYTLNGRPIEDYTIYFAWRETYREKQRALDIAAAIKESTGAELTVFSEVTGIESDCAIIVGDSEHALKAESKSVSEMEYCMDVSGTRICLLSVTEYGFMLLRDMVGAAFAGGEKDITLESTEKLSYADEVIDSMTFNILNWDESAEHLVAIQQVIKRFTPDTIGFQEITATWITKIMTDSKISGMYGYVGKDRGDGTGEQSAIFYRKDKFKLVESGTKWMYGSGTGSNVSGALKTSLYNRVYTYAVLERLSDAKKIVAINTHLDLTGGNMETRNNCQTKQVSYALAMVAELEKKYEISATVFTGDFNASIEKPACVSILNAGFVQAEKNSDRLVGEEAPAGSNYKPSLFPDGRGICRGIDHVFIKSDNIWLEEYEICNQKYRGEYPSDHIPRVARYILQ